MKFRTALGTFLIASLLLLGLDKAGVLSWPRGVAGGILEPFQLGWYRATQAVGDRFGILTHIGTLSTDNLTLHDENDRLKAENSSLTLLKAENDQLRQQLGISQTRSYQLLDSQTLGFVPAATTRQMLLDRGSRDGVKLGQAVVFGQVILGKIVQVEADRATLQLLTDPAMKVLATTSRGAKGILIGQFQSTAKLTKILQQEAVGVGDSVVTSGEEDWPKGFVIGEVTKVTKKDNELFQEAEVKPSVSYDRLSLVFIILGTK